MKISLLIAAVLVNSAFALPHALHNRRLITLKKVDENSDAAEENEHKHKHARELSDATEEHEHKHKHKLMSSVSSVSSAEPEADVTAPDADTADAEIDTASDAGAAEQPKAGDALQSSLAVDETKDYLEQAKELVAFAHADVVQAQGRFDNLTVAYNEKLKIEKEASEAFQAARADHDSAVTNATAALNVTLRQMPAYLAYAKAVLAYKKADKALEPAREALHRASGAADTNETSGSLDAVSTAAAALQKALQDKKKATALLEKTDEAKRKAMHAARSASAKEIEEMAYPVKQAEGVFVSAHAEMRMVKNSLQAAKVRLERAKAAVMTDAKEMSKRKDAYAGALAALNGANKTNPKNAKHHSKGATSDDATSKKTRGLDANDDDSM